MKIGFLVMYVLLFSILSGCSSYHDNPFNEETDNEETDNEEIDNEEIDNEDADNEETFLITWQYPDGTILKDTEVEYGETPRLDPQSHHEAWADISWSPTISPAYSDTTYTAEIDLKESYFEGNVFQVVTYNLGGVPTGTGSGFVFNDEGWFITNSHVMNEAYSADAIFDIPDASKGESYTTLEIDFAAYDQNEKDIFIGKINDYSNIGDDYYEEFTFSTDYEVGHSTYSVGYPNSSISLEINKGEIISDLSSIYDKVYSGISYIGTTSFTAPGSSGGILINDKLEVLGMTTIGITNDGDFEVSGAIETFNYLNLIEEPMDYQLEDFNTFYHPDEKVFIGYFNEAVEDAATGDAVCEIIDNYKRCTYTWDEEGTHDDVDFTYEKTFIIDSDMWMSYKEEYYWSNGGRREQSFYGYYSILDTFDNFNYDFHYTWSDGTYYKITSTDINYSSNVSLTLNDYTISSSYDYNPSDSNIEYAKEQFNYMYEWLDDDMARFD